MKIPVSQLPEGDSIFDFTSRAAAGLKDALCHFQTQGYRVDGEMTLHIALTKLEPEYYLRGLINCPLQQVCARCAEVFRYPVHHRFEIALTHVSHPKAETISGEESEALDMNIFEGNEIDLKPIIEEQLLLSVPFQVFCKTNCKGICPQCFKNLNEGDCGCELILASHPFSVLKNLKQ